MIIMHLCHFRVNGCQCLLRGISLKYREKFRENLYLESVVSNNHFSASSATGKSSAPYNYLLTQIFYQFSKLVSWAYESATCTT